MFANMRGTGANNLLQHNLAQSKQFTCTYICILVLGKLPFWCCAFRVTGSASSGWLGTSCRTL